MQWFCLTSVALFKVRPIRVLSPQATPTLGKCALGFAQFKADGLGEVSRPHV